MMMVEKEFSRAREDLSKRCCRRLSADYKQRAKRATRRIEKEAIKKGLDVRPGYALTHRDAS